MSTMPPWPNAPRAVSRSDSVPVGFMLFAMAAMSSPPAPRVAVDLLVV